MTITHDKTTLPAWFNVDEIAPAGYREKVTAIHDELAALLPAVAKASSVAVTLQKEFDTSALGLDDDLYGKTREWAGLDKLARVGRLLENLALVTTGQTPTADDFAELCEEHDVHLDEHASG